MIDRAYIEQIKSSLPAVWGDERFFGNGPVITPADWSCAPPPPSEAKPDFIYDNPRSKAKGMDFVAALTNDSQRKAQERAAAKAIQPKWAESAKRPLDAAQCAEVLRRLDAGDFISAIAEHFGVNRDCIYAIKEKGVAPRLRPNRRKPNPDCPHGHTTKHGHDAYGKQRMKCHDCGKVWRVK